MPRPDQNPAPSLNRHLGLLDAIAVGWGAIIGAGIFVVIGVAAGVAGPAFLIALVIAALVAAFNALSSAQLAARYPTSGGTYEYGYEVLHPWAGFSAGWMFLASKLAAGGTVAIGFGSYVAGMIPGIPPKAAAVAAVTGLTFANWFGIRKVGKLNLAIVIVTLAVLLTFAAAGAFSFRPENLEPFAPHGGPAILTAAALIFFAYTGYARIATLAEEVRDPKRTIPRAIIISLATAALLYFLVALVAAGSVGTEALASTRSPLSLAAGKIGTPGLALIIGVGAATAMLGVLLSQVLGISRVMLAMGRRGDLPAAMSHVSERFGVPDRAILLTGGIVAVLAAFGTLEWVVAAATFTILLYYAITNVAALRLERAARLYPDWIAVAGLTSCLLLAFSLQAITILSGLALLIVGFCLRWLFRRFGKFSSLLAPRP